MRVYHVTQSAAIIEAEQVTAQRGYLIDFPDRLWCEHVNYGSTVKYSFPLFRKDGRNTKKWVHIQLYRMDKGMYELNTYIN